MARLLHAIAVASCLAGVWTWSTVIHGACTDGQKATCTRNGCQGVRECVGGRMLGCEVDEQCLRQPPILDAIVINQVVPGQEVGVLFDGASFNDRGAIATAGGTTASRLVQNLRAPAFGNSLVTFSRSRQPRRVPAFWTPGADTIDAELLNNIRFNVTFWILAGDVETQRTRAAAAVLAVNNAYTTERAGIRIGWTTVNDATADTDAAALLTGGSVQQFQDNIGFNRGEINVYVINTVNAGLIMGVNFDGTPVILLGRDSLTFPQLLEHELGHAFVLWHVGAPDYNFQNVMAPVVSAHFLTEGQTFRMHFHPSSQLNVFNLRRGLPTFVCGEPLTNDCPIGSRRLWADGDLPPN